MVNAFFDAFWQADLLGKLIFLSLFTMSIMSWVLLLYKLRVARRMRELSVGFAEQFRQNRKIPLSVAFDSDATPEAPNSFLEIYQILKHHAVEILKKNQGMGEEKRQPCLSNSDLDLVEAHLEGGISKQVQHLEENLFVLSTIASLAPLLGLLGTVWGILITFSQLHTEGAALGNQMVLSGLAMALTTTVLGLIVAIPAFVGYNVLRHRSQFFAVEMEDFAADMLGALEMHYRRVDAH